MTRLCWIQVHEEDSISCVCEKGKPLCNNTKNKTTTRYYTRENTNYNMRLVSMFITNSRIESYWETLLQWKSHFIMGKEMNQIFQMNSIIVCVCVTVYMSKEKNHLQCMVSIILKRSSIAQKFSTRALFLSLSPNNSNHRECNSRCATICTN